MKNINVNTIYTNNSNLENKIKLNNSQPFVTIPVDFAQNKDLSAETRATGVYLASLPKDWQPRPSEIQTNLGYGNRVWRKVSEELRIHGYLKLHRGGNEKLGTFLEFCIHKFSYSRKVQNERVGEAETFKMNRYTNITNTNPKTHTTNTTTNTKTQKNKFAVVDFVREDSIDVPYLKERELTNSDYFDNHCFDEKQLQSLFERMHKLDAKGGTLKSLKFWAQRHGIKKLEEKVGYTEKRAKSNPWGLLRCALQQDYPDLEKIKVEKQEADKKLTDENYERKMKAAEIEHERRINDYKTKNQSLVSERDVGHILCNLNLLQKPMVGDAQFEMTR